MLNLSTAIWGELSGSALADHISTRLFEDEAPAGSDYPYVVYSIVTVSPEKTFAAKEEFADYIIQFTLVSDTSESTEIKGMHADLKTLYDESTFAITGATLVWMFWESTTPTVEYHTTPSGTHRVQVYHVDYNVRTILD